MGCGETGKETEVERGRATTAGRQTDPGVQRRQPHLHAPQPLSQCSDLTPELTLPLAQVLHIHPETERNNTKSKAILIIFTFKF